MKKFLWRWQSQSQWSSVVLMHSGFAYFSDRSSESWKILRKSEEKQQQQAKVMLFIQRRKRRRSAAVEISDGDFALERSNFAFARKSVHCQSCQGSTKHSPPKVKYQIDCTSAFYCSHQNKGILKIAKRFWEWTYLEEVLRAVDLCAKVHTLQAVGDLLAWNCHSTLEIDLGVLSQNWKSKIYLLCLA